MYVRAGILDEVRGDASVTAALLADESITDRQRQVLQEIYAAFQKENAGAQIAAMASTVATNPGSDVDELGTTQLVETNKHHHTANALAPSDA